MPLNATQTVRELAAELPNAARVFEKLGIDYCCGGGKSLEEACADANVPVAQVLQSLEAEPASPAATDWNTASLADLVGHIVETHHVYVKSETPRLEHLVAKVVSVHGKNHPELLKVQQVFRGLAEELAHHMMKEEQILFPYIVEMEQTATARRPIRPPMFGTVKNPVHMMMMEHDSAGAALRDMREATSGFTAPADACMSYNTLYRALPEFEADLHQHIHLENNILFPRAIAMEKGRGDSSGTE